jgi:sugar fermentation stimulation protein A
MNDMRIAMKVLKLYNTFEEAYFLERLNRFVMVLQAKNGNTLHAYVPNTGRMEEFCFEHHPFFITPLKNSKFPYKVVATTYQNNFVFLDTLKVNNLFFQLLTNNLITRFHNATQIKREVTFGNSKFDFAFVHKHTNIIVEVKSCTLCHNRLAMFPDAPTLRGQKHLAALDRLAREQRFSTYIIFLILNASAERFMPNFHTDFDYGNLFFSAKNVNFNAFKLAFIDPVSIDLQSLQEVPIDFSTAKTHCNNKGSYLLLLENPEDRTLTVGKLGNIRFQKGWYVYVGSALHALDSRINRHQKKRKKIFWHIDYIASTVMNVKKVYPIRRAEKIESQLAHAIGEISDGSIKHFGTSDTHDSSHLLYFKTPPSRNRQFVEIILNDRTL